MVDLPAKHPENFTQYSQELDRSSSLCSLMINCIYDCMRVIPVWVCVDKDLEKKKGGKVMEMKEELEYGESVSQTEGKRGKKT